MEKDSEFKFSETEEIVHFLFTTTIDSAVKESVILKKDLLQSASEEVGKNRIGGVKVNYLELATGSSAKISTPHRNVQNIEVTPRKSSRIAVLSKPVISEIQKTLNGKGLKFSGKYEKEPKEIKIQELFEANNIINVNKVVENSKKAVPRNNSRKKVAIEEFIEQPTTGSDDTAEDMIKKPTKKGSKITVRKTVEKTLDETIEVHSEVKSRRGKKLHDKVETQSRNGCIEINEVEKSINVVLTDGTVIVSAEASLLMEEQSVVIVELKKKDVAEPVQKLCKTARKATEILSKTTDVFATPVKRGRKKALAIETDAKVIEKISVITDKLSKETPKRGRNKMVKTVENKSIQPEVPLINEAQTEANDDDIASETPRRGRRKLVRNVKKTDLVVTKREETLVGKIQIKEKIAEQDPVINGLCSETPKRGRKQTVKNAETRSVVVELKQKEATVDESQIVENFAKQEPMTTDKLSTETPKSGRKKNVKNKSVITNNKHLDEPQNSTVKESQNIVAAQREFASTDKLCWETPFKGIKKIAKNVANKKRDLVEVELKEEDVSVENLQMAKKEVNKSSANKNLGRETPLRARKKADKKADTKPVISKKIGKSETKPEQNDETIKTDEKAATVSRASKKRKSEPEVNSSGNETSITTDLIPKRRLRGTAVKDVVETPQMKDYQETKAKDVTIDTETVEANSRKRKIKPLAEEANIITIGKKSRAKASIELIEELSADESMVQKKDNPEPKPSRAKRFIVSTEVKRSTRRKN